MSKFLALFAASVFGLSLEAAQVTIAWDANPEPNVTGYRLYRGTVSGNYDSIVDVGNTTQANVADLTPGTRYFFTLTAYNSDGLESTPASELTYIPPLITGNSPIANSANFTLGEDAGMPITLTGSDPNGDPITFQIVTQPQRGTLSGTLPRVTYTPAANFNGSDSFTFRVSDGANTSAPAQITILVTPSNDKPVAFSQTRTVAEDGSLAIVLAGGDIDGDPISFAVRTQPLRGALTGTPPNLTYRPAPNYTGPDSFTFLASDGKLSSAVATVNITVQPINDPPVGLTQSITATQNAGTPIQLSATDPDGDDLVYRVITPPLRGTLSGIAPNLIYTPNAGYSGLDRFTFTASDATTTSAATAIEITVSGGPSTPIATSQSLTVKEDGLLPITLSGTPAAGGALSIFVLTPPVNGVLSGTPPNISYRPSKDFFGSDNFTFIVRENGIDSDSAVVSLTVTPVNDPPVGSDQSITLSQDGSAAVVLSYSDADGDPITYSILQSPTRGTLSGTAPNLTYTPAPGFAGTDSFTYTASDKSSTGASSTVTLSVQQISTTPRGNPDQIIVTQGGDAVRLVDGSTSVLDNDAPNSSANPLLAQLITAPTHGELSLALNGQFHYRHDGGLSVEDSFTYLVSRDGLVSAPVTVSVSIFRWTGASRSASQLDLTFSAAPGVTYDLQMTTETPRPDGNWTSAAGLLSSQGTSIQVTRIAPVVPTYFRAICRAPSGWLVTEPLGAYPVVVNPGQSILSSPLQNFPTFIGDVAGMSRDTVIISSPLWQIGQFDPRDGFTQYAVVVRSTVVGSPARAGDWWPVTVTGTDRLRLDTRGNDLRQALALGDEIELRRLVSFADLFTLPLGNVALANGDTMAQYGPSGARVDLAYVSTATTPASLYVLNNDRTLRNATVLTAPTLIPGGGMQFNRQGPQVALQLLGRVQGFGLTHYAPSGVELVSTPFPTPTTLEQSGLLQSGWIDEIVGSATARDELWFVEGTNPVLSVTHRTVANQSNSWYANGAWVPNQSLQPAKAAWLIIAPRTTTYRWRQPSPW